MNKVITIFILLIGLIGLVIFFPIHFADNECCVAEVLAYKMNYAHKMHFNRDFTDHHQLAKHYVVPFGLLWWSSIGLVYFNLKKLTIK